MKMSDMDIWFEARGYDTSSRYDRIAHNYEFTISKDGHTLRGRFTYPGCSSKAFVDTEQRKFMENMLKEFEQAYPGKPDRPFEMLRCPICGCLPNVEITAKWTIDNDDCKISCCGYTFEDAFQTGCIRKWNQHVENRNKLMNGFMFNTPLSNSIQKEVELMNNYMVNDAIKTAKAYAELDDLMVRRCAPQIKKVHFNNPATVILWTDGTKTIVRAQDGEAYDPEKGMALAIAKKFLGNKGNYYNVFDKYLSELEKVDCKECPGTAHGRKTECTWNQDIPCPTKKDVEKPKYEQLMIKDCSIGDEVYIRDGLINGCRGAIGLCGIVDVGKSNDGLLPDNPGVNILLRTGKVWRVNPDCIVERIKKAPSGKKNKK